MRPSIRNQTPPPSSCLDDLGELYHDFSIFGVSNRQLPGIYRINQQCKEPVLRAYLQYALAEAKNKAHDPVSFLEMFCADGYYAMLAVRYGASRSVGIDNNRDGHLPMAGRIADRLGLADRTTFLQMDANDIDKLKPVDVVANIGGLYHVDNPQQILNVSARMARRFLLVQSVVSLAGNDPDYFESPAPGWTWGCRFSRASFDGLIRSTGLEIVAQHFNELEGNARPEDRGSVYYLLRQPATGEMQ